MCYDRQETRRPSTGRERDGTSTLRIRGASSTSPHAHAQAAQHALQGAHREHLPRERSACRALRRNRRDKLQASEEKLRVAASSEGTNLAPEQAAGERRGGSGSETQPGLQPGTSSLANLLDERVQVRTALPKAPHDHRAHWRYREVARLQRAHGGISPARRSARLRLRETQFHVKLAHDSEV